MKRAGGSPIDVATALKFLRGLRANNSRQWFAANRSVYDERIKPEFEDLIAVLLITAARTDERYAHVDPKRCAFRIHRDVRFSHDKSPYKTAISAFLTLHQSKGSTPGFYVAIEPGGNSIAAAGVYMPDKPALAAIRRRIADGDPAFDRLLRSRKLAPYLPLDTDPLARVPAGFHKEHPRADLLRARRFLVRRSFHDNELTGGDPVALFTAAIDETAPLVAWLNESYADVAGAEAFDE